MRALGKWACTPEVGRAHVHDNLGDRFGLGPVDWHGCEELGHSLGAAPFDDAKGHGSGHRAQP